MRCPVCGEEKKLDYCDNCGFKEKSCCICGKEIGYEDKVCPACGCFIIQLSSNAFNERISKLKRIKPLCFLDRVFALSCYEEFNLHKENEGVANRGTLRSIILSIESDYENLNSSTAKMELTSIENKKKPEEKKIVNSQNLNSLPSPTNQITGEREHLRKKSQETNVKNQVINLENKNTFEDMDELIESIITDSKIREKNNHQPPKEISVERISLDEIHNNTSSKDTNSCISDQENRKQVKCNHYKNAEVSGNAASGLEYTTSINSFNHKNDYMTGVLDDEETNEDSIIEEIYNPEGSNQQVKETRRNKKRKFGKKKIVFKNYVATDYDGYYNDVKVVDGGKYVNDSRKKIMNEYKWIIFGSIAAIITGITLIIMGFL